MNIEESHPVVENQQQPSTHETSNYCICKRESNSLILPCNGHNCPCNNKFHPECFKMSPEEIQKAVSSCSHLCPMCKDKERRSEPPKHISKKHRVDRDESDEEYNVEEDNEITFSSEDDNYRQVSVSDGDDDDEEDSEPVYKRRSGRSLTIKGHPWSDESDNEGSTRPKLRSQLSEPSESESTRRSTRIRRHAYSPQAFMESEESETEVVSPYTIVPSTDSGSKIEKILGRRVLPNTEEEGIILKRSRLAIGIHNDNQEDESLKKDLPNEKFEYLVKWKHQSYSHLSWISCDSLINDNPPHGKSRFYRFVKMLPRDDNGLIIEYPSSTPPEQFFNPNYTEIERVVACSNDMSVDLDQFWMDSAKDIIDRLSDVCIGGYYYIDPFMHKVDEMLDGAVGYYNIVKEPMWMNLIISRLNNTRAAKDMEEVKVENETYSSVDEFFRDMELVFSNCHLYNTDPQSGIVIMCEKLEEIYAEKKAAYYEKFYEMNEIVNSLNADGTDEVKYLVKWVDLSYKDCTWEKASMINNDMIKDFERRQIIPDFKLLPPKSKAERVSRGERSILHFKDNKTLRDYQWEGFRWMKENYNQGKNSILADEMGLGKTIQVISLMEHVIHNMETTQPILVIAPLSTLGFWRREIESWTSLNVVLYHDNEGGKEVRRLIERYEFHYSQPTPENLPPIYKFDILLTTYEIAIADVEELKDIKWSLVVIDEAQRMKNKTGKLQQTLRMMRWQQCVLLTGTPLQNNMTELWTLLNFVAPQTFPSSTEFLKQYGNLQNQDQVASLQRVLHEFVLRRLKEDVEGSIPPKQETIIDVEMTTKQKTYYRAIYDHNRDFFIRGYVHTGMGLTKVTNANKGPRLMNMEIQFRKCCNHPFLLEGVEEMEREINPNQEIKDVMDSPLVQSSGKMVLLHKLLSKLKAEGHRVLIFSQFTMMLDLIERYLRLAGHAFTRIDGSVRGNAREDAIKAFNEENSSIFCFLLSTRAGGVGITLTSADTVIIFDSDWNPQNDVQAQARAHRIGQKKAVRVYRLITRGTYESAMFQRASMKLGLEQAVMSNTRKSVNPDLVETLLKEGAYSALLEENEGDEKSKVFCESDINDLLEKRSRVVTYDKGNASSIFSKTSFVSSKSDSKLDVNDPMFWKKVFGEDSRETIVERLEDGRATKDAAAKEKYMEELDGMCKEVIEQKLSGENVPDWYPLLHTALEQVISLTERFTEEERQKAGHWLHEVEKPSRKRKPVATSKKEAITEDSYSLADPDYSANGKDALSDEVCCRCYHDYGLIQCKGPCRRCFHPECTENPPSGKKRDTWQCEDCINHSYECMICHERGYDANFYDELVKSGVIEEPEDGDENIVRRLKNKKRRLKRRSNDDDYEAYSSHGGKKKGSFKQNPLVHNPNVVFKCLVKTCGRFYHVNCIQSLEYGSKERFADLTRFRCPCHFCCTCHETGNTKHLVQCMLCSNASHVACLSESCGHRMSKLYYICKNHDIPKGIPTWDANKKRMISDDLSYKTRERRSEKRSRPKAEKQTYEPINYTVPIEEYKGNWCRYCGARRSSGFMKGPWGPKTLCVVHYVDWFRKKVLDLSAYPELPTTPINIEANTEPKYMVFLETKKRKESGE